MSLKCGLVGLPACGKTTIYNAVTASRVVGGAGLNYAVVNVPDLRVQKLVEIYHPLKTVQASLELFDIPGIKANSAADGYSTKMLGHIKDVDVMLHVVQCFTEGAIQPVRDIETVDLELMVADSQTVQNKITRVVKRARCGDKEAARETAICEKVKAALDEGVAARKQNLTEVEQAALYECNLLSLKPVLYIANVKSMDDNCGGQIEQMQAIAAAEGSELVKICGQDENDIAQLDPSDRPEFLKALGLKESSVERLLQAAYRTLKIVTFFTVGPDEVRAWTCRKGDKAPTAAGKIHSDMERGFVRMEVFKYDDLIELGSEDAVVKALKKRSENKYYEVQDGDCVVVLFNK